MDLYLRDRVYVVTGGSRGLGFAAAEVLVAEGAAAEAAARLTQDARSAGRLAWVAADNADAATPARPIAAAEDRFGRLDGALISVGGTPPGTIATTPDEAWRTAFEMKCAPASPRRFRCAGTASPPSSGDWPRSCSPRLHPT